MNEALAFAAVVDTQPLLEPDAIVVLAGDGQGRLDFAIGVMARCRSRPLMVLSGGLDAPPFSLPSLELARRAIDKGVDPERLVIDDASRNTREQAVNVVAMAVERGWTKLLLVVSGFHAYRAVLTFVQALIDTDQQERVRIINAPASQLPWFKNVEPLDKTRLDMLHDEMRKIEDYRVMGHVARYEDGLAYLKYWEGR